MARLIRLSVGSASGTAGGRLGIEIALADGVRAVTPGILEQYGTPGVNEPSFGQYLYDNREAVAGAVAAAVGNTIDFVTSELGDIATANREARSQIGAAAAEDWIRSNLENDLFKENRTICDEKCTKDAYP